MYFWIYFMNQYLCQQFSKGATETGHLCHRQDPTDLHAARLVQSDPGAAAVLWRQEEPGNKSDNEDRSDLQQGQLCLSWRSNYELSVWLERLWKNILSFLETRYSAYSFTLTVSMVSRSHLSRFCNMSVILFSDIPNLWQVVVFHQRTSTVSWPFDSFPF